MSRGKRELERTKSRTPDIVFWNSTHFVISEIGERQQLLNSIILTSNTGNS